MTTDLTVEFEIMCFEISDYLMIAYKKSEGLWVNT